MELKTIRVVGPEEAGGYVVINESDFDESVHTLYVEAEAPVVPPAITREALDAALAQLPADYTDPEYVLTHMRSHFGDLFTAEDEAKVRELVIAQKPVSAADLKAALDAKGIAYKGNASKAELQALLDAAPQA